MPAKKPTRRIRARAFRKKAASNPSKTAMLKNLEIFAKKGRTRGQRISAIYEIGKVASSRELQPKAYRIFEDIIAVEKDPEVLRYVTQAIVRINYGKGAELLLEIARKHPAEHERPLRILAIEGIASLTKAMDAKQLKNIYSQLEKLKESYTPGTADRAAIDKTLKKLKARMQS